MIELRNSEMALVGNPPEERTMEEIINNGFVIIDKQAKPSSHQVSAWVRDMLGVGKAGHAGTLDPMVTGVLVVAVGLDPDNTGVTATRFASSDYLGFSRDRIPRINRFTEAYICVS